MTAVFSSAHDDEPAQVRNELLHKIANDSSLPALGSSIAQVVQLASSSDEAVRNLAHFVLSDAGLTQKILRLANTVAYRTSSGTAVTTISRAIFVLGFDAVKTSALAMLLVDGMSGKHAHYVRAELSHALCASIVGRELARRSHFKDSEEAAVAALFKNMGRLLVAAHGHLYYREIDALIETESLPPQRAAMRVIGCSFESLAESVLREWEIPDSIIHALAAIPSGVVKPARTRQEWMQQVAAFSTTAAALIPHMKDPADDLATRALLTRFGTAFQLDHDAMVALLRTVAEQARVLTTTSKLMPMEPEPDAQQETADTTLAADALPLDILMAAEPELSMSAETCYPSGKPLNARELLLAGVQDVTEMMASGRCKMNDLVLLALETLYRSMGFRFATICVRDARTGQFRARIALGEKNDARQAEFVFAAGVERDLFSLALKNDADLLISDASAANIAALIPAWHRALLPDARSFIVLPLVIQGKPFGLFYGDRINTAPEGVPADETALIKMLKGQVIAALTPR
ncbi:HD-like signal output (HDOD) protein [Actimicrobium sp. GrIS 1.19]|uniref:HDOD domain-containing protein n=1 Tax=Actimicrobium sp. GrIS 1.19 TaxID=3071708 RepID=UPI002DF96D50|nr:HD-like signal output (HDOD) protein [Actimicrobium sp. GrIS 1.19]